MDFPNFTNVRDLREMLEQFDEDVSIAIEGVDGVIFPILPSTLLMKNVYVEGYGIDFLILEVDDDPIQTPD